jgi:hypothetical protein
LFFVFWLGFWLWLVAITTIDPKLFVVFFVVHYREDVQFVGIVERPPDDPVTVIADIEHDAIANRVSRTKSLLERPEILPVGVFGYQVPGFHVLSSSPGIALS